MSSGVNRYDVPIKTLYIVSKTTLSSQSLPVVLTTKLKQPRQKTHKSTEIQIQTGLLVKTKHVKHSKTEKTTVAFYDIRQGIGLLTDDQSSVEFSSVQFAKINVVLSAKHFRTTTVWLVLLTPLSLEKKCLQESPEWGQRWCGGDTGR